MKIERNKAMAAFFKHCQNNLLNNGINDYIGVIIESKEDEKAIIKELRDLGSGDKTDSLYLDTDKYLKTPYNSAVKLSDISSFGFTYSAFEMPANELINVDVIQDDSKRELNDYLILRAFNKPFKSSSLFQDGEFWMSDNPAEANTIDPYAKKAHGKVLTFGLGIGYFVYNALLNDNVESVTVVEYNKPVIEMFNKYLRPQFPKNKEIKIIQGDAFDYWNEEFLDKFDYVFADIWKDNYDGLKIIERMLEEYLPPLEKADFWIERTCYEPVVCSIFRYFDDLSLNRKTKYKGLMKKIEVYFNQDKRVITDPEILKDMMYDMAMIREILAIELL